MHRLSMLNNQNGKQNTNLEKSDVYNEDVENKLSVQPLSIYKEKSVYKENKLFTEKTVLDHRFRSSKY